MSRIPRFQEHLKTGFTAEAASAARFRAYAARARADGLPNLARRWLRLAAAKDALAVELLEAAEQVRGTDADLGNAISEERYENDILYPKMIRDVDQETGQRLPAGRHRPEGAPAPARSAARGAQRRPGRRRPAPRGRPRHGAFGAGVVGGAKRDVEVPAFLGRPAL